MDVSTRGRTALLRPLLLLLLLLCVGPLLARRRFQQSFVDKVALARARALLRSTPLVDGHNDLPWQLYKRVSNKLSDVTLDGDMRLKWVTSRTDIGRMRSGMVGAQFWVVYVSCTRQFTTAVRRGLEQLDVIKRIVNEYPRHLRIVTTADGITQSFKDGRIGSLIGVEGGHVIDSSMATLRMFYDLGARYMSLTHNCNTPWSENSLADRNETIAHWGLTDFGKAVVREMNRLGMMVDLSHVSKATMRDAVMTSLAPVIFSHSSAWALCHHNRNVPDDIIKLAAEYGGVIMINFHADFINCFPSDGRNATLAQVADHIEHVRRVAGARHVGIGSDFDGGITVPTGLEDVSKFPHLFAELVRRGWNTKDLRNLAGENLIRVFKRVETVRDILRGVKPSETLLPDEL